MDWKIFWGFGKMKEEDESIPVCEHEHEKEPGKE